jgi:aryl carrier-like protein
MVFFVPPFLDSLLSCFKYFVSQRKELLERPPFLALMPSDSIPVVQSIASQTRQHHVAVGLSPGLQNSQSPTLADWYYVVNREQKPPVIIFDQIDSTVGAFILFR